MGHRLTTQQEAFCDRLASGASQVEAYLHAYPKARLWQKDNAISQASRLAARPMIRARVAELRQRVSDGVVLERVRVIRELARLALFDPRGIVHRDGPNKGKFKTLEELDEATAAGIASYKVSENGIEVRFHSKTAALEQAAKHLGLFERDNEQRKDPLTSLLAGLSGNVVGVTKDLAPAINIETQED